ncbi:MAG: hypothetical protein A4E50_01508 [Methanosaeta sp. PtaB.Bin087]|nr:MAG: hypothetical protein A4E50_01508 [Methanosaeta sp. PtaB.Bin087]OPY53073.1 MAG: hypothetical protein A4E51_01201 [Methanosaeta sp. PtaU1.Bin055]
MAFVTPNLTDSIFTDGGRSRTSWWTPSVISISPVLLTVARPSGYIVTESTGRLRIVIASTPAGPSSAMAAWERARIRTRKARIFFMISTPDLSEAYRLPYYIMFFQPHFSPEPSPTVGIESQPILVSLDGVATLISVYRTSLP